MQVYEWMCVCLKEKKRIRDSECAHEREWVYVVHTHLLLSRPTICAYKVLVKEVHSTCAYGVIVPTV